MEKDFNSWNILKKNLNRTGRVFFAHPREIWWCSLGVNVGFEQDGTGEVGERPVLILKGFSQRVCWAVPLTTSTKKNPYHISLGTVGGKEAFAIISQIRLIDTKRLVNKIGFIDKKSFDDTRKAVKDLI